MCRKLDSQCKIIKCHQNFHRDFRQELHRSHLRSSLEGNPSSLTRTESPPLETTKGNLITQRQGRGENGTSHGRGQPSSRKKLDCLVKNQAVLISQISIQFSPLYLTHLYLISKVILAGQLGRGLFLPYISFPLKSFLIVVTFFSLPFFLLSPCPKKIVSSGLQEPFASDIETRLIYIICLYIFISSSTLRQSSFISLTSFAHASSTSYLCFLLLPFITPILIINHSMFSFIFFSHIPK